MKKHLLLLSLALFVMCGHVLGQPSFSEPTTLFLLHSSGNHLTVGDDGGGYLEAPTAANPQRMIFIPVGQDYYNILAEGTTFFLAKYNDWNTSFVENGDQDNAKFSIEMVSKSYIRLRCKGNNKCLGTDNDGAGSKVFSDKSGTDAKHYWYLSDKVNAVPAEDTISFAVSPLLVRQQFDGWGVSLCWWANMCGKWTDDKIDEIIDWLVSPTGLNYSHFRYNIGGGDDPENRHCTPHHMGSGKGLRAEMEGFKDSSDDVYHWDRDAAQRKIMLKIKEKRPDAVFEAFSNSCPFYMTYSGCVAGNTDAKKDNLKPEYYEEFAHYLVDVCKHYKDEYGIEFKTLEPFNEPYTNYWGANGGQEGCHFDYASQVNFLRVLEPVLKESGLKTVIASSDETSVASSVTGFLQHRNSDVLPLVGQWNTHTYSGSIPDRVHLAFLVRQAGKTLWMSEVGAGGSGISGNLSLAQKLIDDMRYLQPEAWFDWQYIEEGNDQWCLVRGSFSGQTYSRVKNYYVRQQFSRFIGRGSSIITSLNNQSLAALNAARDTLTLVMLNTGSKANYKVDLSQFASIASAAQVKAYRTSQSQSLAVVSDFSIADGSLTITLPQQSITTLLIPCRPAAASAELRTDCDYLIVPRHETTRALTASEQGEVTLQDILPGMEGQAWRLVADGSAYAIENARGQRLTSHWAVSSSGLDAVTTAAAEQTFIVEAVDEPYVRISCADYPAKAFDLVSEKTEAGTKIGTWEYASDTPTHRQWMLFPLIAAEEEIIDHIRTVTPTAVRTDGVYTLSGQRLTAPRKGFNIIGGKKVIVR